MFSKLKQIKDLRDKAKMIQSALAEELIEVEHKGVKIQMDGNQNVKLIHIEDALMSDKIRLQTVLADAMNETVKKVQKAMAMKLQKMGTLDIPGLS